MNQFNNILKIAEKYLSCPMCKRKYHAKEIKVRGFFDHIFFLETTCSNKHQPIIINALISTKPIGKDVINFVNNKINNTADDTILMSKALENFSGDFEKLWKQ